VRLSEADAKLFYRLWWELLAFINRELEIAPEAPEAAQIHALPYAKINQMRQALYEEQPELLDRFIAANPAGFSAEELAIVASWHHRVINDFYIFRHLKGYSVFLAAKEPQHLYGVVGLLESFEEVARGHPLPVLVKAVLLPFKNQITYDGLLSAYNVYFGSGIRGDLNQTYKRLKARDGIIESLVGPDNTPTIATNITKQAANKPATDWRPAITEIVAKTEKMRQPGVPVEGAALNLLRAVAALTQVVVTEPENSAEQQRRLTQTRKALTKLENLLIDAEWE
jgi:hypothetical protein